MEMSLDDALTKCAGGLLVMSMAFLLSQEFWSNILYAVEYIEQWIAKKLGKDEGTDDQARFTVPKAL